MAKQTRPSSTPIPIRFSERMLAEIEEVAGQLELSRQDVIRLSVAAGIKALRRIGYDGIASAVAAEISAGDLQAPSPDSGNEPAPTQAPKSAKPSKKKA